MKSGSGRRFFLSLTVLGFSILCLPEIPLSQEPPKGLWNLEVKGIRVRVEVARTEAEKAKGLMFRQKLARDEGMLFVYEKAGWLTFWMKNTPLPLSIAFLDEKGTIVDIQDMIPFSLRSHVSALPARYALEMNQGWFRENGVFIGDAVVFPSSFPR